MVGNRRALRHVERFDPPDAPRTSRMACGLLAAMLMWLNPAILMDANVWPQWDVWVLPPFLLAALLASVEWWFAAGLVFGLGTMFKGSFSSVPRS